MVERTGVATMKGKPVVLLGHEVKVGQKAPDFVVQATDMSDARLSDFQGKIKLIASVPSLDTPVCDLEIRHFNQEAVSISKDVVILFISMDLPFAQKRFCSAADIKNVKTFSDHRTADFGIKYGVLIKGQRLLSRAIFIVDKDGIVRYVQYVKEEGTQPDYRAALKALRMVAASP
ncbi:MAG: thiol peroxidase [Candidatus Omnitrophica bacterium]|nr:thiol peroxidase [Candidatus Omnitrophota bacterium]MDE2008687.1 thiol peroxidase [Candidatus Omnitrophota bacterium]MDE2214828.1 thiol peroxidase [Candidatus Omnitrophota bacterium]MDE2231948.1 thiol peroxidase [Candidatus Omnitrophota bacterium]